MTQITCPENSVQIMSNQLKNNTSLKNLQNRSCLFVFHFYHFFLNNVSKFYWFDTIWTPFSGQVIWVIFLKWFQQCIGPTFYADWILAPLTKHLPYLDGDISFYFLTEEKKFFSTMTQSIVNWCGFYDLPIQYISKFTLCIIAWDKNFLCSNQTQSSSYSEDKVIRI